MKNKKKKESEEIQRMHHDLLDDLGYGDSDEERALDEGFREIVAPKPNNASGTKSASKGPIDLFFRRPETAIERKKKNEKSRQSSIREACDKEATARVHQYIARFGTKLVCLLIWSS